MDFSIYSGISGNKKNMKRKHTASLLFLTIWLVALTYIYNNEGFKNFYEEMDYYTTLDCSKKNIQNVLSKLRDRYLEEFGFLLSTTKAFSFPPYFYFVLRCIPLQKLIEETQGLPYGFVRNLLFLKYRFIIESHLKNCIDPITYNYGHYKGQHQRIWNLPNKRWVYLTLKNIIKDPEYPYLIRDIDSGYYKVMRVLAIDALGEATYNRKKVVRFLKSLVSMRKIEDELNNISLYDLSFPSLLSLGVLGEKEFVNSYIRNIQTLQTIYLFRGQPNVYFLLQFRIADLYVYTQQYKEALNVFMGLMFGGDKTFFYNMACLFSLMGKKKQALLMLKKAIKAGYDDLRWIRKDKELDLIRNTKQFKRLEKYLEKKLRSR